MSRNQRYLSGQPEKTFRFTWAYCTVPLLGLVWAGLWHPPAKSQIIPDATLPSPSRVNSDGNTWRIEGGTPSGNALFHSFSEFSLNSGETAWFNQGVEIKHIFTRVTGGNISTLDGLLKVNGNTHLWTINPNGIIFGPNASLEIGGSAVFSTGDRLTFGDRGVYSAIDPNAPPTLLTVNVPIGIQFGSNPGPIQVRGIGHDLSFSAENGALLRTDRTDGLQVQPGQTLALLGGHITLDGGILTAPAGEIDLRSVQNLELLIQSENSRLTLDPTSITQDAGLIQLTNSALVDVSGDRGGMITLGAQQIKLAQGSSILTLTQGEEAGGAIAVNASDLIELSGRTPSGQFPTSFVTWTNGQGAGGDLTITSDRMRLQNGAALATGTDAAGNAGALSIRARTVELGGLSASGARLTGILSNSGVPATGDGGNVTIDAERLSLEGGAVISVSTFQDGTGGNLTVRASEITLQGTSADGNVGSGFYARGTTPTATGNAGNVLIETQSLRLGDRATINVANRGTGDAGNFTLQTQTLDLDNQAIITASTREGEKGNIIIQAQDVYLRRSSEIITNAGNADGGNITIATQNLTALENSDITANAVEGRGGQVSIDAQGIFGTQFRPVQTPQSDITATSEIGPQFSGVVEINTPDVQPASGLLQLPPPVLTSNVEMATGCLADGGNEFTITGRGGLPQDPTQMLRGTAVWPDLRGGLAAQAGADHHPRGHDLHPSLSETPSPGLKEATGWIMNEQQVTLVVISPHLNRSDPWYSYNAECNRF
jgi:filamentous hemagglutinin family protein